LVAATPEFARAAVRGARTRARLAAERRREEDRRRVRIEQDFEPIEAMPALRFVRPIDAIGVERGAAKLGRGDAAMPDVPGLVLWVAETEFDDRPRGIVFGVADQRDAGRVPRVEREVERVLRLDPPDADS
jgi:hypothetical protein